MNQLGWIYAISGGGYLKLGWSSVSPHTRLSTFQTANPFILQLVGFVPGTRTDEQALHSGCSEYHVLGEWFHYRERIARGFEVAKTANELFAALEIRERRSAPVEVVKNQPKPSQLGERLFAIRTRPENAKRWPSARQLSMACGLSKSTVSNIERGGSAMPSTVAALASVLNVRVSELIDSDRASFQADHSPSADKRSA